LEAGQFGELGPQWEGVISECGVARPQLRIDFADSCAESCGVHLASVI
jgi:hypothetical protein